MIHRCAARRRYLGAQSAISTDDSYEASERLQSLIARVAVLATIAASGETELLPATLRGEFSGLLCELAHEAYDAAEELTESLAGWLNRIEGLRA